MDKIDKNHIANLEFRSGQEQAKVQQNRWVDRHTGLAVALALLTLFGIILGVYALAQIPVPPSADDDAPAVSTTNNAAKKAGKGPEKSSVD